MIRRQTAGVRTRARNALQNRQKPSLSSKTYDRIKADIIACELAPGETLTETQLCARYRLGKAPVRSALQRLAQERLVNPRPRHGYVVSPVTLQSTHDLFDLRRILEPAAARLAAGRVDARQLMKLDAMMKTGFTPGERSSERGFLRANKAFHVAIAQASGNEKLARVLESVLDEMERLFHLGFATRRKAEDVRHEHRELIEALVRGDKDTAERCTIEQIEAARNMVTAALLDSAQVRCMNLTPD